MSSSNLAAPIIVPEERASVQSVGMARALVRLTSKRDESLTDIDVEAIFGEWSLLNAASFSEYTRANFEKAATLTRALNPTHQLPRRRARSSWSVGTASRRPRSRRAYGRSCTSRAALRRRPPSRRLCLTTTPARRSSGCARDEPWAAHRIGDAVIWRGCRLRPARAPSSASVARRSSSVGSPAEVHGQFASHRIDTMRKADIALSALYPHSCTAARRHRLLLDQAATHLMEPMKDEQHRQRTPTPILADIAPLAP
jgi:hypothetical protein